MYRFSLHFLLPLLFNFKKILTYISEFQFVFLIFLLLFLCLVSNQLFSLLGLVPGVKTLFVKQGDLRRGPLPSGARLGAPALEPLATSPCSSNLSAFVETVSRELGPWPGPQGIFSFLASSVSLDKKDCPSDFS